MNVEIIIENDNWDSKKIKKLIEDAAKAVFAYLKLHHDDIEISVLCTGDEEIRVLNKTYRGIDSPTNVLSFPMESDFEYDDFDCSCGGDCHCAHSEECGCGCDADIASNAMECGCGCDADTDSGAISCVLGCSAFAYETIDRESKEQGKSFDDHMKHLVVHSVLHLLGYDHIEDEEAEKMEDLETKILQTIGVGDPYQMKE
ncbi:MAG: rRNA maturation RNase YbeY [Alphaproteobacteria bacterium]|nr:rRNA maturation RNase YbeY [Alphaproteobacteria bacterium]